eukprot:TRINITY_DN70516_c0_g1_i1.p1 TRINITY_DN70516_c0_g1~~TRINITY_DN70516_c0_g1_i1.p1  ORF type:complete len:484 (+),score=226.19 TRINITY_DN70516_c0_g1_i1:87-1454(+)
MGEPEEEYSADYYRARLVALEQVAQSEEHRTGFLETALRLAKQQLDELNSRRSTADQDHGRHESYLAQLAEGAAAREAEAARLQEQLDATRAKIAEKEAAMEQLREETRREELRAHVAQEMQRLRRETADSIGQPSRKLALAAVLRLINQRIRHLESDRDTALRGHAEQGRLAQRQQQANQGLREQTEQAKVSIEEELRQQKGSIESIAQQIEATRREITAVEENCVELEAAPAAVAERIAELQNSTAELRENLAAAERDRLAVEEDKQSLAERIVRSQDPARKMAESMMLLKAAVINLYKDYGAIVQVRDRILRRADQEAVFKEAHNSIKTALRIDLHLPPSKQWTRGGALITDKDVGMKGRKQPLQAHENRAIFKALQEMVVAWDVMPEERWGSMATCEEVVANAMLLYALARHTLGELNKILAERKQGLGAAEKRAGSLTIPQPRPSRGGAR